MLEKLYDFFSLFSTSLTVQSWTFWQLIKNSRDSHIPPRVNLAIGCQLCIDRTPGKEGKNFIFWSTYLTTKSNWEKANIMIPIKVEIAPCNTGANICWRLIMILLFLFPILVTKPWKQKNWVSKKAVVDF